MTKKRKAQLIVFSGAFIGMHDSKAVQAVIKTAKAHASGPIESIELEIGELSEFDAGHLAEHLREIVDWKIAAVQTPGRVHCSHCGFKGHPLILERDHDSAVFVCPDCRKKPAVLSGTEIKVKKITLVP